MLPMIVLLGICFLIKYLLQKRTTYHSHKPLTIYYTPPKKVSVDFAAQFYEVSDEKALSALFYFWADQGYLSIEAKEQKILFFKLHHYIIHRGEKLTSAPVLYQDLLFVFLKHKESTQLNKMKYSQFSSYEKKLASAYKAQKKAYYEKVEKKFWGFIPYTTEVVNPKGEDLYEQIRGFEYFLKHVEEPRLRTMLNENPNYFDEVLPRAVLFGVETKFLKAVEQIVGELKNPDRYSGDVPFSPMLIHAMTSQIHSASNPPSGSG